MRTDPRHPRTMTVSEDVPAETIATATRRSSFLAALASGPKRKRDLRDELDVSRSTVYKAVRELDEQGLVERTDDGLVLTLAGRMVESAYATFHGTVADVCRTRELLSNLPRTVDVPPALLDDADVVTAQRHAPNRPVRLFEELVRDADVVRGISPVALPQYVEVFHEQATDGDLAADLVLEKPVVEYLLSEYGDEFGETLETGRLAVWETEATLPFGLVVVEGERSVVGVVAYDERGELRGLVVNESIEAVTWGRKTFDEYRSSGTRLQPGPVQ